MKKSDAKEPLVEKNSWAVIGLICTFVLFGVISFLGQRILSTMILNNKMDLSTYQSRVYQFNLIVGILFSVGLAVFFAATIGGTSGSRRAGFAVGSISSLAPVFGALSTVILFRVIGLPSMGAGSVIAAAASALLMALPCLIMFIIFACCRKLKPSSRISGLLVGILTLLVALYPVTITVLSLVVMPGNPALAPFMQLSAYIIHARPLVIALGIGIFYFMNRYNGKVKHGIADVQSTEAV